VAVSGSGKRRTPSATLIMRVWRETGSGQPFRARFAAVHADGHTTEVGIVASPDEALATVSHWIEEFLSVDSPTGLE
jgi:hypothetical protein